jgi:hypothetical protein
MWGYTYYAMIRIINVVFLGDERIINIHSTPISSVCYVHRQEAWCPGLSKYNTDEYILILHPHLRIISNKILITCKCLK